MPIERNIRRNSDLKYIMVHHSEHFTPVVGKDMNTALVQEGFFGVPFDIVINVDGTYDLTSRWIRGATPNQYVTNVPRYTLFKYTLHDVADACTAAQMNYQAMHVLLIGNFDINLPSISQANALEKLVLQARKKVSTILDVLLHSDVVGISCPGVRFGELIRRDYLRTLLLNTVEAPVLYEPLPVSN